MSKVLVKIEGLRDAATAVEVARLGADAVGLVFAPSPRRVTPEQAREIVSAVPPGVATIGVFVNAPSDEINRILDETGVQIAQLHGDEPPEIVARIDAPCIKAFRVRDERWVEEVRQWLRGNRDAPHSSPQRIGNVPTFSPSTVTVLLDAYDPGVRGGSGRRFNWDLIAHERGAHEGGGGASQAGELRGIGPVILAGGLDSDCVAEAIRKVRPWAVDVASGVESSPGVKDLGKVKAFIEAVRAACT